MTQQKSADYPRLMELPSDGSAFRPDELEGVDIVILDSMDVTTSDGRQSAQWVVRTPDGRERLFWCAGKGPMQQVRQWFRTHRQLPLYAILSRHSSEWSNGTIWVLHQRDAEGETMQVPVGQAQSADGQDVADQVPF